MKRKNWVYTEAPGTKAGQMRCRDCNKHIVKGPYRYYETEHAYVPQCEICASQDVLWKNHFEKVNDEIKKHKSALADNNLCVLIERIKEAFFEGWHSYATPAAAYNSPEEAWEESEVKNIYDALKLTGETK